MKDYAKFYKRRYESEPVKKLNLIRRVLRSRVSTTLMVAAIMLIVETSKRKP